MMNTKMIKMTIAAFVAALAIGGMVSISSHAAEANNSQNTNADIVQTADTDSEAAKAKEEYEKAQLQKRYEYNMNQFTYYQSITRDVKISNIGLYHAKSVKLYGRKIVDVDKNTGDYILSDWECLTDTSINGYADMNLKISGTYVSFAYSFDITWGTDYPYSGIFYKDIYNIDEKGITITMGGCVRNASIKIMVGYQTVVDIADCGSHSEWRP